MCQFHTVLEDYDRDVKNQTLPGYAKCDHNLNSGWYRFLNISGITMPTECPPRYTCGTLYPGWLKGDHPTVDEGEVKRAVCFSKGLGRCCKVFVTISRMSVPLLFHVQLNITKLWIQSLLSRFDGKYRLVRASLFIYWASLSLYFD